MLSTFFLLTSSLVTFLLVQNVVQESRRRLRYGRFFGW